MTLPVPSESALFDEAPCGLLVTALDGTVLKVNATFCTWVGMPREDLVGVKRMQDLFTMGGRIFHQTHWVPTLQMSAYVRARPAPGWLAIRMTAGLVADGMVDET